MAFAPRHATTCGRRARANSVIATSTPPRFRPATRVSFSTLCAPEVEASAGPGAQGLVREVLGTRSISSNLAMLCNNPMPGQL